MIRAFMLPLAVALVFLAAAPGCAVESTDPLGPLADAVRDPSLPGRWTCVTPGDPEMTVTVAESRSREYAIEIAATPQVRTARLRAFLTQTDQGPTLNVQQIGASDLVSANRHIRARYARSPDEALVVTVLTEHANAPASYDALLRCTRP